MATISKTTGKRTILGTDWPVETVVERRENKVGKPYWTVVFGLCNGVPDRGENFKTRKAALEAAGIEADK